MTKEEILKKIARREIRGMNANGDPTILGPWEVDVETLAELLSTLTNQVENL